MTAENHRFPCERCGICCRNIGNAPFTKDMVLPSGICKYLDEETNLCRIYSTRPIFCNVDALYDKYLSNKMMRVEYYKQNKEACRRFQSNKTTPKETKLEEWVLPVIQSLTNEQAKDESLNEEQRKLFEQFGIEPTVRKIITESNSSSAKHSEDTSSKIETTIDTSKFNLEFKDDKERAIYEKNGITPDDRKSVPASSVPLRFREQIEAQERAMKIKAGKNPLDVEWELFEENELIINPPDEEIAEQHLDKYISLLPKSIESEDICYKHFLDFLHGREKIKSIPFAEKMLGKITNTRDADKLLNIVDYFEKQHALAKAEPFYFTLYEVFRRGEGTQKDLNKAANYLKNSISGTNTDEKRKALRELYEEKNSKLDEKNRIRKAYEQVISDNIQFAKNDYAIYLRGQGEYTEAIHWFVADGKFAEAYEIVDLKVKEKINSTIEEFTSTDNVDSKYLKALKLIQAKFEDLQDIFAFDNPEKTPRTYIGIALMYTIFGIFYTFIRTAQRSPFGLIAGLLICGLAFFGGWKFGHIGLGVLPLVVWTFISIYLDSRRRKKFVSACELWLKLPEHPALKERITVFKDSQKIIGQSKNSWVFIFPVVATIFFASVTFAAFEMPSESREEILEQIEAESLEKEEKEKIQQTELPKTKRDDSDKSLEDKTNTPKKIDEEKPEKVSAVAKEDKTTPTKIPDETKPEKVPAVAKEDKTTPTKIPDETKPEKVSAVAKEDKTTPTKIPDETKPEKVPAATEEDKSNSTKTPDEMKFADVNPLLTQTDVGKVFGNYYRAVNDRRYTDAYLYLTANCKNRLGSIENFAVGHKDTLSVEIIDFQQVAASAEAMKATYKICTRDKATNGVKVQIFEGQVTMVKINDKWLIDNLSSQLFETHLE